MSRLLPRPEPLSPKLNLPQTLALTLSCGIVGCQQRVLASFHCGSVAHSRPGPGSAVNQSAWRMNSLSGGGVSANGKRGCPLMTRRKCRLSQWRASSQPIGACVVFLRGRLKFQPGDFRLQTRETSSRQTDVPAERRSFSRSEMKPGPLFRFRAGVCVRLGLEVRFFWGRRLETRGSR